MDPRAVEQDAAAVGRSNPTMTLRRVLFPAPFTDDGDDVAVVDPERHAVDRRETAEAFRDCIDLEKQRSAPRL